MTERILIADDSLSVREAAQAALAGRGAVLTVVADGRQASSRLGESPFDLVLADVHMPGPDGYALCREAKGQRSGPRVLLLVGTFEPFDSSAAGAARADGVVRKPFTAEELARKVEELLGPPAPSEAEPAAPGPPPDAAAGRAPTLGGEIEEERPSAQLSERDVERIARRVLELGGEAVLERVAREMLAAAARRHAAEIPEPGPGAGGTAEDD